MRWWVANPRPERDQPVSYTREFPPPFPILQQAMPPKGRPAFVEDFDESLDNIVPNSQQVANTGAKVSSRLDPRLQEPLIDVASDSGYSSRTAATVNSTQSGPSGGRSPPPLKTDLPKQRTTELARTTSHRDRDRRDKERAARRHEEKVQMAAYGPSHLQTRMHRSPSKSNRRNSYVPSPADIYYEGSRPYHSSTPVDPPPMDYYSPMFARPPMPDFPPPMSPHAVGYPDQEYHSSRHPHSGSYRSSMYHQDPRPWSVGLRGYPQHQQQPLAPPPPPSHGYDRGPPPPSGAWHGHQGSYSSSPYGAPSYMQSDYYPQEPSYRERSESRPRDPSRRRPSMYSQQQLPPPPPMAAEDMFPPEWDDEQGMEEFYRQAEKPRGRVSKAISPDYDDDRRRRVSKAPSPDYEDARRMPPPSRPAHKTAKIHQRTRPEARKSQSSTAVPGNRHSSGLDLFELDDLLHNDPDYAVPSRRAPKELPPALGRSQSVAGGRRSTSYRENRRSGVMENSLRRRGRETYYHDDNGGSSVEDLEETERDAEEYQRVTSGLPANGHVPLSDEGAFLPKARTGLPSETGSRKSGSNSSRGSATKTEKENQNMTLSLNGMSIAFAEESLTGKSISIRTGDQGSMQFNITDGTTRRQPKQYVQESTYSERTGTGSRRALEDGSSRYMRTRDDGRSEKSVHRSSRSGRSNHGQRYH